MLLFDNFTKGLECLDELALVDVSGQVGGDAPVVNARGQLRSRRRISPPYRSYLRDSPVIREASIYDRKLAFDSPGHRVLITRRWPRGVRREAVDTWLKDAAPSRELLDAYHDGLPWADFEQAYRAEILEQRPGVLAELRQLEQAHDIIWLLCYERIPPQTHCHRQVLKALLEQTASTPVG